MYFAYFDESGDSGVGPKSPTRFFVLACILMHATEWAASLDELIKLRRDLRRSYGLPVRPEIKALDFVKGRGGMSGSGLDRPARLRLYEECLSRVSQIPAFSVFAVAVDKVPADKAGWEPRAAAWTFALQRVDRFCLERSELATIYPDEGHTQLIRPLLRRLRRFQKVRGAYGGKRNIRIERVVEDPNERQSQLSYFVQAADWAAYAAHRSDYVDPKGIISGGVWDLLAPAHLTAVNKVRGGPPAIVRYP
jgi:hypothetical protein